MVQRAKNIDAREHFQCGTLAGLDGTLNMIREKRLKKRFESLARLVQIDVKLIQQTAERSPALVEVINNEIRNKERTDVEILYVDAIVALIKIMHGYMTWQKRTELFVIFHLKIKHKYADIRALRPTVQAIVEHSARQEDHSVVEDLLDDLNTLDGNIYMQVRQPSSQPTRRTASVKIYVKFSTSATSATWATWRWYDRYI